MPRLAFWLLPAILCAAPARYARLGEFDGQVEVQLNAADDWRPASRNMPVPELAWIRTGASSRVELELDDGSFLRLASNSLAELSDYTRLSTGQRITLISLDHGLAYFTGAVEGNDALILAVPGAQVTLRRPTRLRLEVGDSSSQIATLEGVLRFSSPTAEFDLPAGRTTRLDPAHPAKFYLYPEVAPHETDRWSDERDKVLASATSAAHVPALRYGLADLDAHGAWIESAGMGTIWKPKVPQGWTPFRDGKWLWYDGLGYTWISADVWGWLPYHYGRWIQDANAGWMWAAGQSKVFKPGEVYWLKSAKLAGWGPLVAGEDWRPPAMPRLFLNANTTYAAFALDAREIDPAGFARPDGAPAAAVFALALPSPAFPAARLDASRPVLRAGSTRIVPVLTGVTFDAPRDEAPAPPPRDAAPVTANYAAPPPAEQPVVVVTNPPPAQAPEDTYYPAPIYTGIIVVNPPEHDHDGDRRAGGGNHVSKPPVESPAPAPHHQPEPPRERPPEPEKPDKPVK